MSNPNKPLSPFTQSSFFASTILITLSLIFVHPRFQLPELIDLEAPDDAKTRTGFDGQEYELVFSDEFNVDGRTFFPGDDPFWEALYICYGATAYHELYDPNQVTTANGSLVITMDQVTDQTQNHMLPYKSGMLQSWNKFCFTSGYIEVSVTLPGPDSNTQGYVSFYPTYASRVSVTHGSVSVAWYLDDG